MAVGPGGIPPISLATSSSADSGDLVLTPEFSVDFGDKNGGGGGSSMGGPFDDMIGIGLNFLKLTAVAVISGYVLKKVKF
jgi:hypothetical protein